MRINMFSLYLLPFIIFTISIMGIILNRSNIILILICIEIMLLSISINLILHSILLETILGQIYSIYIITVASV